MPDPLFHSLLSGISLFAGFSSVSAFAFSKDIYALKKKKKKNRKEKGLCNPQYRNLIRKRHSFSKSPGRGRGKLSV